MKEPLPQAVPLIERAYLERLAAEREFDVGTNWRAAVLGGVTVTAAILVAAELFGAVGALSAIAAPFAVMFILDQRNQHVRNMD